MSKFINYLTFMKDASFRLIFDQEILIITIFLLIILSCVFLLIMSTSLLQNIIYLSCCSLCLVLIYLFLDAPDVAMTEAAINCCLSTIILLLVLKKIDNKIVNNVKLSHLFGFMFISCLLVFYTKDLVDIGDSSSPAQQHLGKFYLENTASNIGIPSVVAAILASYRGFDTMGETLVIVTAVVAIKFVLNYKSEQ